MSSVPQISPELLAHFRNTTTGFVTDAAGRLGLRIWMEDILPMRQGWRVCGRARPIKYVPRSGATGRRGPSMYEMLRSFAPGDVAVFAGMGTRTFILGENLVHEALHAGLGGIVADGRARDADEIRALSLPVFATGVSVRPFQAEMELLGCDQPVYCGGAFVRPGDLVIGDGDGVVAVPHAVAAAFVEEIADLTALEEEQERALEARVSLQDLNRIITRKKQRKGPPLDPAAIGMD